MKSRAWKCALLLVSVFTLVATSAQAQQIPREHTRILALGDSITEGLGNSKSYRFELTNELDSTACSYEMVGSLKSNRDGSFNQPPEKSSHEGYSGHGVEFFLNSLSPNPGIDAIITEHDPDVVLIHLGSNDMNRSQGVIETGDELRRLVNRIWAVKSNISIYVANVIPWYGSSSNSSIQQNIAQLGPRYRTVTNNFNSNQIHYVNVKNNFLLSDMNGDGIHPNPSGDRKIANAFLARIRANNDCPTPPITFISSPLNENAVVPNTHTFTGSAVDTDADGIQRVRIAIEDSNYTSSSNRWFNFSTGQFGSFSEKNAALANVTPTTVNWSISASLPSNGDYRIYALAVDSRGNQNYFNSGVWPVNTRFFTNGDNSSPSVVITTPPANTQLTPNTAFVYRGTANDSGGSGFKDVRFAIRSITQSRWYNFSNNSFNGATGNGAVAANLTNTSNSNTNWNYSLALPAGQYAVYANARDNAGNISGFSSRSFTIAPNDNQSPTTAFASPSANNVTLPSTASFSGNASDAGGSGFSDVRFAIRSLTLSKWYNFSNTSFNGAAGNGAISANLTNTSTNSTNWNRSVTLPPGDYAVYVNAIDNAGNISGFSNRRFTIAPNDNQSPSISFNTPSNNATLSTNASFSGSATDSGGSGFNDVRFAIRSLTQARWYNFSNNSFSGAVANGATDANLTNTSTNSTNWNYNLTLPPGNYRVYVNARDIAGNTSGYTSRGFSVQ